MSRRLVLAGALLALSACAPALPFGSTPVPSVRPLAARPTPPFESAAGGWYGPRSPIQPVGEADLFGEVALRPDVHGDYVLRITVWAGSNGARPLGDFRWQLVEGRCADLPRIALPLRRTWRAERSEGRVRADELGTGPAMWLAAESQSIEACADLPVAAARDRQPLGASSAQIVRLRVEAGRDLRGTLAVSPTASGDRLLLVLVEGTETRKADGSPRLLWHLSTGACGNLMQVLLRSTFQTDGARQEFTLVLPRGETIGSLGAWVDGGGPLVACADLPA